MGSNKNFSLLIVVAALGYFVDVYDLLLFGVVKSASLTDLGIKDNQLEVGLTLTNYQLIGLIIGGLVWGMLGDLRGRLSVLFGSIFIYSLANIANAYVETFEAYKWCRLFAGIGLAGELGAGITLVMETAGKKDNWGPQIITGFGLLGAVLAGIFGEMFHWRTTYLIGGGMGLILLVLRMSVKDSQMFLNQKEDSIKGNFLMFFNQKDRFLRYINCILIGMPVYFVIALLIQSAKDLGSQSGLSTNSAKATIICYISFALSDFMFTHYSNKIQNRKKIFIGLHIASFFMLFFFLYFPAKNEFIFYTKYALFGITIGYWGLLTVNASEQFGTNMRALASTTIPNFIRGSFYFVGEGFKMLKVSEGLNSAILIVGMSVILISFIASLRMEDRFNETLDRQEI
jgi:MFS transporter, putative metabolite:H+ symporter